MLLMTFNNQRLFEHTWKCELCPAVTTKKMTRVNAMRVKICGSAGCKQEQARRRAEKQSRQKRLSNEQ
jgi:hypothetical protein